MLIGTIVNAAAILVGALLGSLLQKGFPQRLGTALMTGVALCVVYIGLDGMLSGDSDKMLVVILSMVIGGVAGELLQLDERIHRLGDRLEKRFAKGQSRFSEGFVSGSLLFCVGAMAVVGALDDGLTQNHSTLFAKALLDGISSIVFGSSMGLGVAFSAFSVLLYQGLIAVCADIASPLLSPIVITEMKCVGSILIFGLGLNLLELTKIKVMNYLPALFLPILLCRFL